MYNKQQQVLLKILREYLKGEIKEIDSQIINEVGFWHFVKEQRLFPFIYKAIGQCVTDYDLQEMNYKEYSAYVNTINISLKNIDELFRAAEKSGVNFVVIKGVALSQSIYGDFYSRSMNDIDTLTTESNMLDVDKELRSLKYEQFLDFKPDVVLDKPILKGKNNHEFFPYRKFCEGELVYVEVGRSLHERVRGEYVQKLIDNAVTMEVDEHKYRTLDVQGTLVQLIENTYENYAGDYCVRTSATRLRDYLDLVLFIKKYQCSLSFILNTLDEFGLNYESFWVFNNALVLFPEEEILAILVHSIKNIDESVKYHFNPYRFWERLFDLDASLNQYLRDIKEHVYGINNDYYLKLNHDDFIQVDFSIGSNKATLKYKIQLVENLLHIVLNIQNMKKLDLNEHLVQILIYNNNLASKIGAISLEFFAKDNKIYSCETSTPYFAERNRHIKRGFMWERRQEVMVMNTCDQMEIDYIIDTKTSELILNSDALLAVDIALMERTSENMYGLLCKNSDENSVPLFVI